jgi:Flp pilus assembly protein TadG
MHPSQHNFTRGLRPPTQRHLQQGAAAVEFALILPILLLVFFGMIELSLALYDKAILTNASREGARAGIVLSSPKMTDAQIRAVVLNYTNGSLISLGTTTAPTVTVIQSNPASFPNALRVTVSYTYKGLGVGTMLAALGSPIVLTSSTLMVNE